MSYVALHASLRPDKLAVVDLSSGQSWTYRALHEHVARCVRVLRQLGAESGDRIACLSKNRAEIILLHLAVTRIGAMLVPLNWRLARNELRALLEDCQPRLLFGDAQADQAGLTCIAMDEFASSCSRAEASWEAAGDSSLPSLLLYTSGTTGLPKGAMLSETNIAETAINSTLLCAVDSSSAYLCDAPMFHVIGLVTNVRPALFNGGTVIVSDGFDPERTLERMTDPSLGVTHYFCVPQMANALRQSPAFDPEKLRHLKAIFTGGAPHPPSQIEAWLDDGIPIVDGLGMSECGTVFGMPIDEECIRTRAGSVGIPTPRVHARICDTNDTEVDVGVAGELQLRGDNICTGYWHRSTDWQDALTGDGWFRTGDIATVDESGFYRIVDRRKDMYISGGENVYPAEVEAAVCAHDLVKECAVVGVPDDKWGEVGWLFVVPHAAAELDENSVLEFLDGKLARYKLPKHVSRLDALPRNGAGKVIKGALRDLARAGDQT